MKQKLTLEERAAISRRMAKEHRTIAAHTLRLAEQMERDAILMDRGIDPYKEEVTP